MSEVGKDTLILTDETNKKDYVFSDCILYKCKGIVINGLKGQRF